MDDKIFKWIFYLNFCKDKYLNYQIYKYNIVIKIFVSI